VKPTAKTPPWVIRPQKHTQEPRSGFQKIAPGQSDSASAALGHRPKKRKLPLPIRWGETYKGGVRGSQLFHCRECLHCKIEL
jgi:hypothetical protein